MVSTGVHWFLKILLFRSFQIVQRSRPERICHRELSILLLYGVEAHFLMLLIMSPKILQALWHLNVSFSHNLFAKLHESMRFCMVLLCFL